jgi:hypothetical protein
MPVVSLDSLVSSPLEEAHLLLRCLSCLQDLPSTLSAPLEGVGAATVQRTCEHIPTSCHQAGHVNREGREDRAWTTAMVRRLDYFTCQCRSFLSLSPPKTRNTSKRRTSTPHTNADPIHASLQHCGRQKAMPWCKVNCGAASRSTRL